MQLNISYSLNEKIDRLVEANLFKSKKEIVELMGAVGIKMDEKREIHDPLVIDVKDFDQFKILAISAMGKNRDLKTRKDVINELERYIEAGSKMMGENVDIYEIYERMRY